MKQSEDIARREEAAKKRREHNIVEAREWIDNFYREYNEKKAKSIAKNKCAAFFSYLECSIADKVARAGRTRTPSTRTGKRRWGAARPGSASRT